MSFFNTIGWNRVRYTIYSPIYDNVAKYFYNSRAKSIGALDIPANSKILIVGAGTGLDLEFLPEDSEIVATDIAPSMVRRIQKRNKTLKRGLKAIVMNGQELKFPSQSFDIVVLHLILAVIPDPIACIKEVDRVLKYGGQVAVFDKFIKRGGKVSVLRRLANVVTSFLFSDITRDIGVIVKPTNLEIVSDEEANFNGIFRLVKLVKRQP